MNAIRRTEAQGLKKPSGFHQSTPQGVIDMTAPRVGQGHTGILKRGTGSLKQRTVWGTWGHMRVHEVIRAQNKLECMGSLE